MAPPRALLVALLPLLCLPGLLAAETCHTEGCPSGQTCCKVPQVLGSYACCDYPDAVCCMYFCCPSGTQCDYDNVACESSSASSSIKVFVNVSISAPATITAPKPALLARDLKTPSPSPLNTLRLLRAKPAKPFQSRAMKAPLAVPLVAPLHLLPPSTTTSPPPSSLNATDVLCPNGASTCDDGKTCCLSTHGGYSCCPYPHGTCCDGYDTCCPARKICLGGGRCA